MRRFVVIIAVLGLGLVACAEDETDTGGTTPSFDVEAVARELDITLGQLRRLSGGPRLATELTTREAGAVLDDALRCFGTYHTEPAALRKDERVIHRNRNLLHYYANRLRGYELGGGA